MAKDSRTTSKTVLPEDFIIKVNPHLIVRANGMVVLN